MYTLMRSDGTNAHTVAIKNLASGNIPGKFWHSRLLLIALYAIHLGDAKHNDQHRPHSTSSAWAKDNSHEEKTRSHTKGAEWRTRLTVNRRYDDRSAAVRRRWLGPNPSIAPPILNQMPASFSNEFHRQLWMNTVVIALEISLTRSRRAIDGEDCHSCGRKPLCMKDRRIRRAPFGRIDLRQIVRCSNH